MTNSNNSRKVLIIENEQFISDLYARALHKKNYQVDIEADGLAGFKAAQTNRYDIILLDLMMPNMTGVEILKALKGPNKSQTIKSKIIVATNLEEREEVRDDLERLADAYIIKAEMTPNELVKFIDTVG